MLLIGIILFIVGLLMLIKPKIVWQITEQWKSYSAEEPSNFYIKSIRFGGVMFILAGIGSIIAFFLQ
ncbi:DUF6199 family natural product biosynthesis protein [Clostridium thermosuccinogenes]|uniref:DUF6199 family natural product biosynthesis protein n=1 Tax=Clostridium thermosuccinogenes TaxID=84032 RepID=UPI000CCBED88|nr:DUF6199 family natural product biosynthesis protein [Pseudoclostridium thermosuccinogenes]PNT90255.1 hypothetical protein CDQ83_20075 [Pseudoclostridium thermosuccinogenes]